MYKRIVELLVLVFAGNDIIGWIILY